MKLYLLRSIAGLEVMTPQQLIAASSCFISCTPEHAYKAVEAYLLCQIANGGSGPVPGACAALSGDAAPTGAVTPQFVGQLYNRNNGESFWYSTGLTNADWVQIVTPCDLSWGPPTSPIDGIDGNNVVGVFTGIEFTEFTFGTITSTVNDINFFTLPTLTRLEFTALTNVGVNLNVFNDAAVTAIVFPALVTVGGSVNVNTNPLLTTLTLPALTSVVTNLNATADGLLSSVSLTSLATVGGTLDFSNAFALPSLNFPALVTVGGNLDFGNCTILTSFSAPVWVPTDVTIINFVGCALDVASVELILRRCVLAGVVACTIDLSGGTNAGTASLSAQGQADVATLGAQVTMNP